MKTRNHPLHTLPIGGAILLSLVLTSQGDTVAYWNFNGLSIATASAPGAGGVPTSIAADVGTGTLSLTGYTGTVDDFGGSLVNALPGVPAEESLSLVAGTAQVGNGSHIEFQVSLTGFQDPILTFATRGTGSGYNTGQWSYSTGGGIFTNFGDSTATTSTTYSAKTVDFSTEDALDGASGVIFRYTVSGATDPSGNNRIDNLLLSATSVGGDTTPPSIASRTPTDDATGVTVDSLGVLTIVFSESVTTGTGNILVKKVSDDSVVNTVDVTDFGQISLNENSVELTMANPLEADTAYYVEIPATAFKDLAPVPNSFPGITGNTGWNFTTAPAATNPTVVVNKYLNSTPDRVELLVIGNGTPGSTVNLQGMILKDFSSSGDGDGGGSYVFSTDPLWAAVKAGTIISLGENATTTDINATDFTLSVGLNDAIYFDGTAGTNFDIATTDIVLLKAAGSGAAGTTGGIHALAAGTLSPTSYFTLFPGAKVLASATTGTNLGVKVENTSGTISDFVSGTDATGGLALTAADFGSPNSATNASYITSLRGLLPGDGDGIAVVTNATAASPLLNKGVFDDGLSGQSLKVAITAQIPSATINGATITIPAEFGAPTTASVSGPGAGGATALVSGQTITISGAAGTSANPFEVTINGLTSPTPTEVNQGAYSVGVSTRASGGTLTPIGSQPTARVIVPISFVRDVTATGVAVDLGAVVALEGVSTEQDFGAGSSNFSGFMQDATGGINVFSSLNDPGLVRDHRFVVIGSIAQFNGLTEIIPSSTTSVIDLGAVTAETPQTVSLTTLLADPESYEGELITVQNLAYVSGTWPTSPGAGTVVLQNGATNIDVRIQAGSTAAAPASYPINVTGVFGQFDSTTPYSAGYQLMPRDNADITPGTAPSGYAGWATTNGIPGELPTGDFDKDGITNLVEYALGLSPTVGGASPGTFNGSIVTFTKGAEAIANGDVDWIIQTSPTLGAAPSAWTNVTATEVGNTISYTLPTGQGKVFVRLLVNQL